jgi:large subunit ribosomal protein L18e
MLTKVRILSPAFFFLGKGENRKGSTSNFEIVINECSEFISDFTGCENFHGCISHLRDEGSKSQTSHQNTYKPNKTRNINLRVGYSALAGINLILVNIKMKSNTKIEAQLKKKNNPVLVETIILAKKNPQWKEVAEVLTNSRKKRKDFNLDQIEKVEEKIIVVCGKVLSQGEITKKKKVVALNFSEKAKEKLLNAGCEALLITEEIKINKDAKDVKILK